MTGHPPRQVSVVGAALAVADTASAAPGDRSGVTIRSPRPWCDAATSAHRTPLHRARGATASASMPCRRRRPGPRVSGRSWSAPCRRAGDGSVPNPAKHGRHPGLHPHRVRTHGSEMARILPVGEPFASGRSCDGRSRMSRPLVPPWPGRHYRCHAVHRARGISSSPWPLPCSRSGRTGHACGPPTTPPTTIGRLPATAEGSESRDKDERAGLRRYRSRYRAVRSATASPPGPGTRLRARSGSQVLAAVGWNGRVGGWFAS